MTGTYIVDKRIKHESSEELLNNAKSLLDEMTQRERRAKSAKTDCDYATAVKFIFGKDFLLFPPFRLINFEEIRNSLESQSTLIREKSQIRMWIQRSTPVRMPLTKLRKVSIFANALGGKMPEFEVIQLPYESGQRWAGVSFSDEDQRPRSGLISILICRYEKVMQENLPIVGLMVDEFVEKIPAPVATTGISFNYEGPSSAPPQTLLVAVPPTDMKCWNLETAVSIVNETFDLAKIRAVDSRLLGQLGQFLPAIYLADNPRNETIATSFVNRTANNPVINK
jgi:hypothetical protein